MSDCIVGATSNTASSDGKFGCDVSGATSFHFMPSAFVNDVTLTNQADGAYTYLDDSGKQRAQAQLSLRATLADGNTATNYTAGCFAQDVTYTFSSLATYAVPMRTFADTGSSLREPNTFDTREGNFSAGVATPIVGINFARNSTVAINPFEVNASMLYAYVEDTDGVVGDGFDSWDGTALYYYARIYAPDYLNISPTHFMAGLFYEVYCDDGCDKGYFGLGGLPESPDYVRWIVNNKQHIATVFDYAGVASVNGLGASGAGTWGINLDLGGRKTPYCDKVSLTPAGWLKYNKYSASSADKASFKACFISQGTWAGRGAVGMTMDRNISKDKNRKIDW